MLSDPRPYAFFVVGTKRIRRFDPGWPAHGAALHHTVGVGPFVLRDATRAVEVDPPRRLLLHAGLRPLGTTQITFTLVSVGERTEVVMEEWPIDGPVARRSEAPGSGVDPLGALEPAEQGDHHRRRPSRRWLLETGGRHGRARAGAAALAARRAGHDRLSLASEHSAARCPETTAPSMLAMNRWRV